MGLLPTERLAHRRFDPLSRCVHQVGSWRFWVVLQGSETGGGIDVKRALVALGMCLVAGLAQAQEQEQEKAMLCVDANRYALELQPQGLVGKPVDRERFSVRIAPIKHSVEAKLTISMQGDATQFECDEQLLGDDSYSCHDGMGSMFVYNGETKRYVWFQTLGVIFPHFRDIDRMSSGTCTGS